jgi:hypothetical protein
MSTKGGVDPNANGEVKEEAGRPANYLAEAIYTLTSTRGKKWKAAETEFGKGANVGRFSPIF